MSTAERGSLTALSMLLWFYERFGRRASVALLTPIVVYFFVTGSAARRASMDYLRTLWACLERARPSAAAQLVHLSAPPIRGEPPRSLDRLDR
jgi:predicted LPLAT superfamily acyltransferase